MKGVLVRTRRRRLFWLAAALLSSVASGGCTSNSSGRPAAAPTTTLATGTALESIYNGGTQRMSVSVVKGMSVLYTPEVLRINEDVTLVDVAPAEVPPGLELLDARLTRLREPSGQRILGGGPGLGCFEEWPPKGFGRAVPARGAELRAGEMVAITFYLRTTASGDLSLIDVQASYQATSGTATLHQRFEHSLNGRFFVVDDLAALPAPEDTNFPSRCDLPQPEWLSP
jgi:hypothetical protein